MILRIALAFISAAPAFAASPCTVAKPECTEWIVFGAGPSRSLIYRTHSLDVPNERITRAVVVVHGQNRDADNYFRSATAAAFLAGALDDAVVISPRFASNAGGSCRDALAANEVGWPCDVWRSGGPGASDGKLTSFDFSDEILRKLASKKAFPNLRMIVFSGHSAGGQFANRYSMSSTVIEALGVPVTFVVSNPSSYAYLDASRPNADGSAFGRYGDARNCTTYNTWPYGSEGRAGYAGKQTLEQLSKQLASRRVIYLLGELDTLPLSGFDDSCPAMAQGSSRLTRGRAWTKYVNEKFHAKHEAVVVPACGHNARCMFTAEAALKVLFPNP